MNSKLEVVAGSGSLDRLVRPSLSGHQSARMKSEVWLTPPEILKALGTFDLDPCAPAVRPWDMARDHISLPADGLEAEWRGRVWLNPPFGSKAAAWLRKMKDHGNGIALIPARTETAMFYESVWGGGDAVCFLKGRPHFHRADGTRAAFNSGAPICLVAYGLDNVEALERASLGVVVRWANTSVSGPCPPTKDDTNKNKLSGG
jgi:hypothetical protein